MEQKTNRTQKAKELLDKLHTFITPSPQSELLRATKSHQKIESSYYDQVNAYLKTLATQDFVTKDDLQHLFAIIRELRIELPPVFDVKILNKQETINVNNLDEIKIPDSIKVEEAEWLQSALVQVSKTISEVIKVQMQDVNITGPTDPRKPIAVRLSDGKQFYTALNQIVQAAGVSAFEQAQIVDLLTQIEENTDDLEIKAENINLNTDTLEALIQFLIDADRADSSSVTSVSVSTTVVTILASNALRKGFIIYNDGATTVFIKYGATATTALFTTRLLPNTGIESTMPLYTGIITAIRSSGTGTALVTEFS